MEFLLVASGIIAFGAFLYLRGRRDEHLKQENDWLRRKIAELTDDMRRLENANRDVYAELQANERRPRGRPTTEEETIEQVLDLVREFQFRIGTERERDEAKYAHWESLMLKLAQAASRNGR